MVKHKFFGVRKRFVMMALLPLFSLVASFSPMFENQVGAVNAGTVDGLAKAWLLMSVIKRGDLNINDNVTSSWLDDFAVIGLDNNTTGIASYRCATGYVGSMISTGDGKAYANYDYGGFSSYTYPCFFNENRKSLFGPIASSMGYDSGTKFFERMGYVRAADGSGHYTNPKGKTEIEGMLKAAWGNQLPYSSLDSGKTPNFIKYDILVNALRDHCDLKDSIFANPKAPTDSGPDILTLVDDSGKVGKFAVQAADDSKGVTVGINTNAGESGSDGQLSCGNIKKALMDPGLANDYSTQILAKDSASSGSTLIAPAGNGSNPPGATTCNIPGIGWILCPVLQTAGKITDAAYGFLADNFLQLDVTLFQNNNTKDAWSRMRDIANVVFVIFFLIIVYSQLTNVGVGNYGIKKMLPRLIVAAILVNISYYICQLAIDISNIAGYSIKGLFGSFGVGSGTGGISGGVTDPKSQWSFFSVITTIIAAGALVWLSLGALIPALLMALVSLLVIFLILIVRKALVVLLVVVAPIAFVAYLLPNTEQWYKKWQKAFVAMLLLFPIIGAVFGASGLAGSILMQAADNPNPLPGGANDQTVLKIIALTAGVLPLLVVPSLLKKSLDGIGSIGVKLNGYGSKAGGALGKAGGNRLNQTNLMRGRTLRKQTKQQFRDRKFAESGVHTRRARGLRSMLPERLQTEQAVYQQEAMQRSATGAAREAESKDINYGSAQLNSEATKQSTYVSKETLKKGGTAYIQDEFSQAIKSGDKVRAKAALQSLKSQGEGGVEAIQETIAKHAVGGGALDNTDMSHTLREYISDSHSDLKKKDSRITNWAGGGETKDIEKANFSSLTDAEVASQTIASISAAQNPTTTVPGGELTTGRADKIRAAAVAGTIEIKDNKRNAMP